MSCRICENEDIDEGYIHTYVRIGNGNVLVAGCKEHLAELIRLLRVAIDDEADEGDY